MTQRQFRVKGGFLFPYKSEPTLIASNDATPAILLPNGAPPTTRH